MARMRALRKSHVSFMPAASSIEKRMPAEVGAAKRAATSASCHASGRGSTKMNQSATKSHGKPAAVIATP